MILERRVIRRRHSGGLHGSVGSGVMGSSDGFESKKVGVTAVGEHGAGRDSALSPFTGLGEAAANLVEVHGVIKWFDASKGYGFIVPDNGWPDVLLHVTVLRRDGFQTAYEGARIVVECIQRAKGYQAFRVVSMDESTAIHPAQMLPPRTHVTVTATSGLERAQVKWFNRLRGFGFLTCGEGTPDILRAHGDAAPLRHDRAAARPVRPGPLWARLQGHDGRRDSSRVRVAGFFALRRCPFPQS
ncbi:cold shock CspA family protein [Bradyrhizobium sp. LM2.7]